MTILPWLLLAYVLAGGLYWLLFLYFGLRTVQAVPVLEHLHPVAPVAWPKLSLIIPACNEADVIEAAVQSRLRDDYPNLEVILIDDRSTDDTGVIVDRLAAADPRVRVVHVRELPSGWLGKVHALQRGTDLATGEWLLYSDADLSVKPGTLRRAVAYALERNLDHLAVFPELWHSTFLLDVVLATFVRILCVGGRLWAVENPRSSASVGVGAFNLVRRSAYEKTAGFEWMRLEIVDDATLGMMLKRAGARCAILNGRGLTGLHFYRSLGDMARGAEKSVFGGVGQFSLTRLVVFCAVVLGLELAPFLGLLPFGVPYVPAMAIAGTGTALLAQVIPWCWMNGRLLPALLPPIGTLCMVGATLRAGVLAVQRGGLMWRGTLYPTELLKHGARFRFP